MNKLICCPKCNYQYLPGEIYHPQHFLGQPKDIIRNNIGEILGYEGIAMNPEETFICDNCGEELKIFAKVSFVVNHQEDELPANDINAVSLF